MPKRLKYKYHRNGELPLPGSKEIVVFGSNERGAHGRGMALVAKELYGAEYGVALGIMGNGRCYGIPTKDRFIRSLSLQEIKKYVSMFIVFTLDHPEKSFWVTAVGCGLAGYKPHQIAPMFKDSSTNCNFPIQWKEYLEPRKAFITRY